jgi:Protein of unknown function (DUF732)
MKVLLSIAMVLVSATALAATAHADPNDAQFLKNIRDNMGRQITDSQSVIASAHEICSELQGGKSADDVIKGVRLGNQDWDYNEAGYFVSASVEAYCPDRIASE